MCNYRDDPSQRNSLISLRHLVVRVCQETLTQVLTNEKRMLYNNNSHIF